MENSRRYQNLLLAIRILPTLMVSIFTAVLLVVVIADNRSKQAAVLTTLKEDFISRQREHVALVVDQISRQITHENSRIEGLLKERLRCRVNRGIDLAAGICRHNPAQPPAELKQMFVDLLSSGDHSDCHRYFIIDKTGAVINNPVVSTTAQMPSPPTLPPLAAPVREEILKAALRRDGGFVREHSPATGPAGKTPRDKLSYVKPFAPFHWIIGSREDIADVRAEIQKKLLAWLAKTYIQKSGYLFIVDREGRTLLFKEGSFLSSDIVVKDGSGQPLNWEQVSAMPGGSGYLQFTEQKSRRIIYVKALREWQWIIGSGVWLSELTPLLGNQKKELSLRSSRELNRLLIIGTLFALGIGVLTYYTSSRIGFRFNRYMESLRRSNREQERARAELYHQERYDTLTNLPNRTLFQEHVSTSMPVEGRILAVASLGLDNFSKINEHFSYTMGDLVLKEVSRRFETVLRNGEMVCHYSGDEFLFCFPDLASRQEAQNRIDAIHRTFTAPILLGEKSITTSCTSGICLAPAEGKTAAELISKSQTVLKRAKNNSRSSVLFYDEKVKEQLDRELAIERLIEDAVDNNEFRLFYQPQIEAASGTICSVEALCRWHNGELGSVSPLEFIPIAEDNDTILRLGEFILEQACRDIVQIQRSQPQDSRPVGVSVNISPRQLLSPHFSRRVQAIVERTGIDCRTITLEITENILINDIATIVPVLEEQRQAGFSISLDDFGTGYSSLRYLNSLPINELKIDKSFIDDMLVSAQAENLVRTIIAIGKSGSMDVVAEGVETLEQTEWLKKHDCTLLQGYFFDCPLPCAKLRERWFGDADDKTTASPSRR